MDLTLPLNFKLTGIFYTIKIQSDEGNAGPKTSMFTALSDKTRITLLGNKTMFEGEKTKVDETTRQ